MKNPEISAVIPCLNEEETLPTCIKKAQDAFSRMGVSAEVVVGDNGSTDKSVEIAQRSGARVVHQNVRGYGAAIRKAIESSEGKYIIMADADDSYDWSNLDPFIRKLDEGYDFVIGNRFRGTIFPNAMPFLHRYFGNPVLSLISRIFYNVNVGDFHCGMRAFTRQAYNAMNLQTEGMEFATEMIVRAARSDLKISEIPIDLRPDKRSRAPHLRTFRDGWRHLRFIMTYAPNYLYLAPGGIMLLVGILLMLLLIKGPLNVAGAYFGIHFLALGLLLTLVGFNVVSQGVIAKLYLLKQTQGMKNRVANWLVNHFSLERGLIAGGFMFGTGFLIDMLLLYKWMIIGGSMESSIHLAFFGTAIIALGVNIIFSAFLIWMLLNDLAFKHKNHFNKRKA